MPRPAAKREPLPDARGEWITAVCAMMPLCPPYQTFEARLADASAKAERILKEADRKFGRGAS